MAKEEIDLTARLKERLGYGRSTMQRWLYENYDQIVAAFPGPRRNWKVLVEEAIEAGLKDAEGQNPNANSIRIAFKRVEQIRKATSIQAEPKAANSEKRPVLDQKTEAREILPTSLVKPRPKRPYEFKVASLKKRSPDE
jgi:hypothetical protein